MQPFQDATVEEIPSDINAMIKTIIYEKEEFSFSRRSCVSKEILKQML